MYGQKFINRLQFYNDQIADKQIKSVSAIETHAAIDHLQGLLLFHLKTMPIGNFKDHAGPVCNCRTHLAGAGQLG